jgi:hypothetical protein
MRGRRAQIALPAAEPFKRLVSHTQRANPQRNLPVAALFLPGLVSGLLSAFVFE